MKIVSISGKLLYNSEKELVKDAVSDAVENGARLGCAHLSCAPLMSANLRDAKLSGADLYDANLCGADLSYADLRGADLSCADLRGADLSCAKLRYANLRDADISGAHLRGADLSYANLSYANLRDANLSGADLRGANLYDANLCGAKEIPFIPLSCPSDGDFTGWKKVGGTLIELRIPEDAKRSSATTVKCRCDKAFVVSIIDIETRETYAEITNYNHEKTTYRVGEMVYPDSFDDDRWNECSHGIHFFINKESAINY